LRVRPAADAAIQEVTMLHEPAAESGPDPASGYKQRLGVIMFAIYGLIYGGFTFINVANAPLMETPVLLGMNLAVVYGFGLIIAALVLAMIYNALCNRRERDADGGKEPS
jgi:uncharacterized membrane protein (DUF485 family)